jgi:acyl carrier protein
MTIAEQLIDWISREALEGADVGLTESTPLLELGLINSLTIVRLQDFASSQFGVRIPHVALTPQNLSSIRAISDLVAGLRGAATRQV